MEQQGQSIRVLSPAGSVELIEESLAQLRAAGYELDTHTDPADTEPSTKQPFPGLAMLMQVEFSSTAPTITREQLQKAFCGALDRTLKIRAN